MERAVARAHLSRSGDSSELPPSVHGQPAERRRGPRRSPTRQPAAWVLVLVVIALVPLLVATWTFGRSYRTSEVGQVDSRLTAMASGLVGELGAAATRTSRVGLSMARSPRLQRALLRGATTSRVSRSPSGDVHVQAGPGSQASPVPRGLDLANGTRSGRSSVIGHVTAWVSITDLLRRLSAKTGVDAAALVDGRVVGGPLRGYAITAPAATPGAVLVDGQPLPGSTSATWSRRVSGAGRSRTPRSRAPSFTASCPQ